MSPTPWQIAHPNLGVHTTGGSHRVTTLREVACVKVVLVLTLCGNKKTHFHTGGISPYINL